MLPKGIGHRSSSGVLAPDLQIAFSSQAAQQSAITPILRIRRNRSGSVNMLLFRDVSI
jgi:hypothetical protein